MKNLLNDNVRCITDLRSVCVLYTIMALKAEVELVEGLSVESYHEIT